MPDDALLPAPTTEWEELGKRLSDELLTLRTSSERLIAAHAENAELHVQAVQARTNAARIVVLLDGLEALGADSLPVQPDTNPA